MYNLPPINPAAFSGNQAPSQPPAQPRDAEMSEYLLRKVDEIKRRMGSEGGSLGACSSIIQNLGEQDG